MITLMVLRTWTVIYPYFIFFNIIAMRTIEQIEEITKDIKSKEILDQTDQDLVDAIDDWFYSLQ